MTVPRRSAVAVRCAAGALALSALLAGCSSEGSSTDSSSAAPVDGGTLKVAMGYAIDCMDPTQTLSYEPKMVFQTMFDTLTVVDADGVVQPSLATSWEVNDDSTQFTLALREGVTFSDGSAFDAEVVKAYFDYIVNTIGSLSTQGTATFKGYVGTEVIDDMTVKVTFDSSRVSFLTLLADTAISITSLASTQVTPDERCTGILIGTGPFTLADYSANSGVSVEKRADYDWAPASTSHEGAAHLDGIDFDFVTEDAVRGGMLTSGQADVITNIDDQEKAAAETGNVDVYSFDTAGVPQTFLLNLTSPVISDETIRYAFTHALDRETIAGVVGSENTAASSVLSPPVVGYASQAELLEYDPDAAIDALEKAGWVEGEDGIRVKDGVSASFTVIYATEWYPNANTTLELMQQELLAVGIDMQISPLPQAEYLDRSTSNDYQAAYSSGGSLDGSVLDTNWRRYLSDDALSTDGLGDLLTEQNTISDVDERLDVLAEIQRIIVENSFLIPVYNNVLINATTKDVGGYGTDGAGRILFYDLWLTS